MNGTCLCGSFGEFWFLLRGEGGCKSCAYDYFCLNNMEW